MGGLEKPIPERRAQEAKCCGSQLCGFLPVSCRAGGGVGGEVQTQGWPSLGRPAPLETPKTGALDLNEDQDAAHTLRKAGCGFFFQASPPLTVAGGGDTALFMPRLEASPWGLRKKAECLSQDLRKLKPAVFRAKTVEHPQDAQRGCGGKRLQSKCQRGNHNPHPRAPSPPPEPGTASHGTAHLLESPNFYSPAHFYRSASSGGWQGGNGKIRPSKCPGRQEVIRRALGTSAAGRARAEGGRACGPDPRGVFTPENKITSEQWHASCIKPKHRPFLGRFVERGSTAPVITMFVSAPKIYTLKTGIEVRPLGGDSKSR